MTARNAEESRQTEVPSQAEQHQRFRIDLGYVGTNFHGWALQPHLRTVQGELETALARILSTPVRVTVAGRTDAGVHARRQVVHVDIAQGDFPRLVGQPRARGEQRTPAQGLKSRLRGVLAYQDAGDIVIHDVAAVHSDFDARFSALWRSYTYRLADPQAFNDPLTAAFTVAHRMDLDVAAMSAAAQQACGLRDFLPFCKPREGSTTIRTLEELRVARDGNGVIEFFLRADAFCHHMVRALVGGLVKVGEGKWAPDGLVGMCEEARRGRSEFPMFVFPAHGLVLEDVGYPEPGEWAVRNQQTRARRDAE